MFTQIAELFTTTKIVPVIFIIVGLVLCVLEIVLNKGYFGLLGGILVIADIFAVMMLKGSMIQFAFLVIASILIIVIAFCIMILIDHNVFVKLPKKDVDNSEIYDDSKLLKLIGKKGFTISECNPNGKFDLNGVTLDGVCEDGNISKNTEIVISKIEGIKLFIKEWKE